MGGPEIIGALVKGGRELMKWLAPTCALTALTIILVGGLHPSGSLHAWRTTALPVFLFSGFATSVLHFPNWLKATWGKYREHTAEEARRKKLESAFQELTVAERTVLSCYLSPWNRGNLSVHLVPAHQAVEGLARAEKIKPDEWKLARGTTRWYCITPEAYAYISTNTEAFRNPEVKAMTELWAQEPYMSAIVFER